MLHFIPFTNLVADKAHYYTSKPVQAHYELMKNLLAFPNDKVFPCIDLYRMFLIHPDASSNFKKFEEGYEYLMRLLGLI
jgi:hypothetical protein